MPPKIAPPRPRAGQQRQKTVQRQRIEGIAGSPGPRVFRASTPSAARQSTPGATPVPSIRDTKKCPNQSCTKQDIFMADDLNWVCRTCGSLAEQDANLVADTQFIETTGGKMAPQGVQIGQDQTHQKNYGQGPGLGVAGREPTANREKSERDAKHTMLRFCAALHVDPVEAEMAMRIFKLAWAMHFIQGRGLENTAAVSLYLALRRRTVQDFGVVRPKYPIMLIDLAEQANVDVFALGKMYTDLVRKLYLDPATGGLQEHESIHLLAYGPEVLIDKFVDALKFENARKVKEDAIRIVSRMKRDWMSTGRRPAGVCGAAVILAARMNNYRRTTREVILIAKVTEITLNKRLEEFKDLPSSALSVQEFRDDGVLDAINPADPPAYQKAHNPQPKKSKRGRPRKRPLPETAAEIEDEAQDDDTLEPTLKRARIDAEGFAIPDLPQQRQTPIDPSLINEEAQSSEDARTSTPARTSKRKTRAKNWRAPPVSAAEAAIEIELERDVLDTLRENPELNPAPEVDTSSHAPQDSAAPEMEDLPPTSTARQKKDPPGPHVNTNDGNTGSISLSPTLLPDEFDDDPEVSICLLSEAERQLKETVWVNANADWLRQDHAKKIKRELKEAEMREKGIDITALENQGKKGPKKRKDGTRRAGRLGDVSYLNDPEPGRAKDIAGTERDDAGQEGAEGGNGDGAGETEREMSERNAADSVRKMLSHRGVFSRKVNYDVVDRLYGLGGSPGGSTSRSRSVSVSQSQREDSAVTIDFVEETDEVEFLGGTGSRAGGRPRSRASIAAERIGRERKKKTEPQRRGGLLASGSPSGDEVVGQTKLPTTTSGTTTQSPPGIEEVIGPITSNKKSPTGAIEVVDEDADQQEQEEGDSLIQPRTFAEDADASDEDESEGDEDDYVQDEDVDVDAAFEGTYVAPPKRAWDGDE